jgi:transposase
VQEWPPEGHLARDVVERLNPSALEQAHSGRGSQAYHPTRSTSLLIDGYSTGDCTSRVIEEVTDDSLAFRFVTANSHPDQDILATFRRRFAREFAGTFVRVVQIDRENQLSRVGTVSLDGTKIHANASRHRALSDGHAEAIEPQRRDEVQDLLALAEAATGRKPAGTPVKAPTSGPNPTDQIDLADANSRIMPVAGGAFQQCDNAHAVVDTETILVLVPQATQAASDKQRLIPMLEHLKAPAGALSQTGQFLADAGYFIDGAVGSDNKAHSGRIHLVRGGR